MQHPKKVHHSVLSPQESTKEEDNEVYILVLKDVKVSKCKKLNWLLPNNFSK
jgi:hypothetical protein